LMFCPFNYRCTHIEAVAVIVWRGYMSFMRFSGWNNLPADESRFITEIISHWLNAFKVYYCCNERLRGEGCCHFSDYFKCVCAFHLLQKQKEKNSFHWSNMGYIKGQAKS
jgi:hypothetical protein